MKAPEHPQQTWGFNDRYATDPEFKKQVDEARKRADNKRDLEMTKEALSQISGKRGKKLY